MSEWQPIEQAPKHGYPVWVRGWDWGKPDTTRHFGWAYWNGSEWREPGAEGHILTHLTDYLPEPPK